MLKLVAEFGEDTLKNMNIIQGKTYFRSIELYVVVRDWSDFSRVRGETNKFRVCSLYLNTQKFVNIRPRFSTHNSYDIYMMKWSDPARSDIRGHNIGLMKSFITILLKLTSYIDSTIDSDHTYIYLCVTHFMRIC